MASTEQQFLEDFNPNSGIVHRICNAFFMDPEQRRDVFQEIVYQLWRSYPGFKHGSKFTTWMYKVALNTAIAHIRKASRALEQAPITILHEQLPTVDENFVLEENIQTLYKAIYCLSPGDKAIILLYLEDHSYDEIAAVTGLTKTNVSVKLTRIKKIIEDQIKSEKP